MKPISLSYYKLNIRFYAEEDVRLDAWIGAVLRNNFLVQAEQVKDTDGISLLAHIEDLPLSDGHPCRKQMEGGFPKGIWVDCRDIPLSRQVSYLDAKRIHTFSILLAGRCVRYYESVVEAVKRMLDVGLGHPVVPLRLVDISETDETGKAHLLCHPDLDALRIPCCATRLSDFVLDGSAPERVVVRIMFETPVCLIRHKVKKEAVVSFQDKLNGFPSLYQFIRSLVYRVSTLDMLYGGDASGLGLREDEIEDFVRRASEAILLKADLEYRKVRSTPKKGNDHVYVMEGYMGELMWREVPSEYLPLLAFAVGLGVGYHVQYGLGSYSIDIQKQTK